MCGKADNDQEEAVAAGVPSTSDADDMPLRDPRQAANVDAVPPGTVCVYLMPLSVYLVLSFCLQYVAVESSKLSWM